MDGSRRNPHPIMKLWKRTRFQRNYMNVRCRTSKEHDVSSLHFRFTDKELKTLLDSLVIIVDTREQKNTHILDYFRKKEITFKFQTMKTGDYSAYIPSNPELGLPRDLYFDVVVERKA